jgi:hypothetical protein
MVSAEHDQLFPEEILEEGRKYLEANNIEHEVRIYQGVPHGKSQCLTMAILEEEADNVISGFAVVGDYKESHIKDAQASAFDQMLSWLKKH